MAPPRRCATRSLRPSPRSFTSHDRPRTGNWAMSGVIALISTQPLGWSRRSKRRSASALSLACWRRIGPRRHGPDDVVQACRRDTGDISVACLCPGETGAERAGAADYEEATKASAWEFDEYAGRTEAFRALGQEDRADEEIDACRRLDEPDNRRALAWLEATAPSGRYRDGRAAVRDATRACEMTHWKDTNALDTLAAAYAPGGRFSARDRARKAGSGEGDPFAAPQVRIGTVAHFGKGKANSGRRPVGRIGARLQPFRRDTGASGRVAPANWRGASGKCRNAVRIRALRMRHAGAPHAPPRIAHGKTAAAPASSQNAHGSPRNAHGSSQNTHGSSRNACQLRRDLPGTSGTAYAVRQDAYASWRETHETRRISCVSRQNRHALDENAHESRDDTPTNSRHYPIDRPDTHESRRETDETPRETDETRHETHSFPGETHASRREACAV